MRDLLGRSGGPQDGDKVICLKNNWDIYSVNDNPLVNGTIGYLKDSFSTYINLPRQITSDGQPKKLDILTANFISDTEEDYGILNMDKQLITTGIPGLDWKTSYKMGRNWRFQDKIPDQFTYGYAITG